MPITQKTKTEKNELDQPFWTPKGKTFCKIIANCLMIPADLPKKMLSQHHLPSQDGTSTVMINDYGNKM
jgi:hypothetical protein